MRSRVSALVSAAVLMVVGARAPGPRPHAPVAAPGTAGSSPLAAAGASPAAEFTSGPTPGGRGPPAVPASAVRADVIAVTDGDTIVLAGIDVGEVHRATGGRKARLIGVDTPEVFGGAECFGAKASAFTRAELESTAVRIAFDVGRTDRYGRALVYVWDDRSRFFNGRLVQEGYALQMTVPPNVRYAELFTDLAREARLSRRGLWSEC